MSVKHSLMALLDEGDRYGYQLRSHFEARTGGTWPLNIGQVYSTLERLTRDGLITRTDGDDERQVHYALIRPEPTQLRVTLQFAIDAAEVADELLDIPAHEG